MARQDSEMVGQLAGSVVLVDGGREPLGAGELAAATIELLASGGFSALKIERVAERAGVGKGTIYRRWRHKEQLVAAMLTQIGEERAAPDTGSTAGDLVAVLQYELGLLTAGLGKASASLFAEAVFNPVRGASRAHAQAARAAGDRDRTGDRAR